MGADEASGLDTITAPIRNARGVLACGWEKVTFAAAGGDDAEATGDKYEEVAATCREGAASRLDTSAAPTRHVRVTNLSSLLLAAAAAEEAAAGADGAHALEAATDAGAAAGLGADEASGLDTITAPIRNARGALACGWVGVAEAAADVKVAGEE